MCPRANGWADARFENLGTPIISWSKARVGYSDIAESPL